MFRIEVFFGSIDPEFKNYLGVVYSLAPPTIGMKLAINIPEKIRQTITINDVIFMENARYDETQTVLISF
jgi:hypothetical protein